MPQNSTATTPTQRQKQRLEMTRKRRKSEQANIKHFFTMLSVDKSYKCIFQWLPVKPQASANKNVLQDMRKKRAVSSKGKSLSLVNLVTWATDLQINYLQHVKIDVAVLWFNRVLLNLFEVNVYRYQSGHDSSRSPHRKRPAKKTQKHPQWFEEGTAVKRVPIVSLGLVCHYRPMRRRERIEQCLFWLNRLTTHRKQV